MAKGLTEHRYFDPGAATRARRAKTVCTSHVLAHFGIDPSTYHYSGTVEQRAAILRKNGYAVRSRNSRVKKCKTVGQVRRVIRSKGRQWDDPKGVVYMLRVRDGDGTHAMLLDARGKTIVDTAPRNRDRRPVLDIRAIFRK